ncbi:MAG: hypothetical protein LBT70_01465 [Holosporaceae bacterium]|jgi:hypothetical protein|nr:hypothetical protein [Holosporaceae bacterium]
MNPRSFMTKFVCKRIAFSLSFILYTITGCANHQKNEFSSDLKNQLAKKSCYIVDCYEYKYKDKVLDLSNNHQLENVWIGYASWIHQLKVPPSLINLIISGSVDVEKSLDLSACKGLTALVIGSYAKLRDVIKMPNSITCLYINNHAQICEKLDLSHCHQLKFLAIENGAQLKEVILPSSLLNLFIDSGVHINGLLDLSRCEQLSSFEAKPGANFENILFPQQLQKVTFGESSLLRKKLDLSKCTHLKHLAIGDYSKFPEGCQLPPFLNELIISFKVNIAGGLDMSQCQQLEKLFIYDPEIILDLSNCRKLKELEISSHSPIGMESLAELEELRIAMGARVNTKLDLSHCINLSSLVIEDDVVISEDVDLSACEKLSVLKIDATEVELKKALILPASLLQLEIGPRVRIKGKIDTSKCKNIKNYKVL